MVKSIRTVKFIGTFDIGDSYPNSGATYINPIRVVNSLDGLNQLYYNPITKEIVYYQL